MTTYINLTGKPITIYNEFGERILHLKPTEKVARASSYHKPYGQVDDIPIYTEECGRITNLPNHRTNVYYIVPKEVKEVTHFRKDVLAPGAPLFGEGGEFLGYKGFVV